jgi:proton-translocating NAD(P)+ transhydrogenase subunit beta
MQFDFIDGLFVLMLATFIGLDVIRRVSRLLHTPLMSLTNAISAIAVVGAILLAGEQESRLSTVLGAIAVFASTTNIVSGFLITDRMLKMFKKSGEEGAAERRQERAMLVVFGVLVAAVILALYGFSVSSGEAEARSALAAHALRYFYILSAFLFILGLKGLSSPRYARRGMFLAEFGMVLAIAGTLFHPEIKSYGWLIVGLVAGSVVGGSMGLRIPMTAVPQRTALSHSLGALAATLIGVSEFMRHGGGDIDTVKMTTIGLEVMIGGLTFTGSLMAAAKLQELLPGAPITYRGQNVSNISLLGIMLASWITLIIVPSLTPLFFLMVGLALLFGFLLVVPIGAADMPVVIALLNSYAGLADASMGFVLMNKIQIITGSLDGTSGFLLSLLMCRAMNRSATNVLFGAFGKIEAEAEGPAAEAKGTVRSIVPDEVPGLLDGARSVVIVPGYGMAVAQAQHGVAELARLLGKRGIDVKYAIHPVAGRMPGHMNVLLAEADVPYDQLWEMEQINPYFAEADLALVVGANDVTNPAARTNKSSPLYGMPILEVDRAKSIIVLKRSMRPGFAGVDNELYYNEKCMMLFGDAKESITKLFLAFKS